MGLSKQQLAQKRNWLKYQLSGIKLVYQEESVTPEELQILNEINLCIKTLLKDFDNNSKLLGLKIPETRCFCGKPATEDYNDYKVCRKCFIEYKRYENKLIQF
jgi:hypothetical protein